MTVRNTAIARCFEMTVGLPVRGRLDYRSSGLITPTYSVRHHWTDPSLTCRIVTVADDGWPRPYGRECETYSRGKEREGKLRGRLEPPLMADRSLYCRVYRFIKEIRFDMPARCHIVHFAPLTVLDILFTDCITLSGQAICDQEDDMVEFTPWDDVVGAIGHVPKSVQESWAKDMSTASGGDTQFFVDTYFTEKPIRLAFHRPAEL